MALIIVTTDSGEEIGRTRIADNGKPWGEQLLRDTNTLIGWIGDALEVDNRNLRLRGANDNL